MCVRFLRQVCYTSWIVCYTSSYWVRKQFMKHSFVTWSLHGEARDSGDVLSLKGFTVCIVVLSLACRCQREHHWAMFRNSLPLSTFQATDLSFKYRFNAYQSLTSTVHQFVAMDRLDLWGKNICFPHHSECPFSWYSNCLLSLGQGSNPFCPTVQLLLNVFQGLSEAQVLGRRPSYKEQERAGRGRKGLPTYVHRVGLCCYDLCGLGNSHV